MKKDVKILSVGTLKGGVGKSTVLFNLAGELARRGNKVLCLDLDPQANTTNNFGITQSEIIYNCRNIFLDIKDFKDLVLINKITDLDIDLIPSSIRLTETEMQIISKAGREKLLLKFFDKNYDDIKCYDYILIDTNPSMSVVNQNAFLVADDIIVITEPSINSLSGAELFIALWSDICDSVMIENNISTVIVNKFESRETSAKDFMEYIKNNDTEISDLVLDTIIPKAVALKDTTEIDNIPVSIIKGSKNKLIREVFISIVDELEKRGVTNG